MTKAILLAITLLVAMVHPGIADALQGVASLPAGSVLRGHFTQERSLQGFQAPLKSEGSFVVAAGKGLIWKVEKPFPTMTVITPAGLVQDVRGAETLRLPAARIPFIARFYDMLSGTMTGDLSGLKQQFDVQTGGTEQNWTLQLTPKISASAGSGDQQTMPIQRMDLTGGHYVQSVDIRRQSGDHDLLTFFDQKVDTQPLSPDEQALLAGAGGQ
jgi:hypothetical protein